MSKYGPLVKGATRSDGRVFKGYQKRNGRVYEQWIRPEYAHQSRLRQREWHVENQKRRKQDPEWVKARRDYMRERMKVVRATKLEQQMLIRARVRAKAKNMKFDLVEADVVIPKRCPVLGIPLRKGEGAPTDNSPELDRINNKKGYVKGNIMVISRKANRIKSDCTPKELMRIAMFYARY